MSLERHERITRVFLEACRIDPADRAPFLDEACAGDRVLRDEVESLLEHDSRAEAVFGATADGPPFEERLSAALARLELVTRPQTIGPYTIMDLLGHGAMGVVYRARQDTPSRVVALKVIQPGIASEAVLRRFEHEVEVLGRLRHPGIAQIYDAGTADTGHGPQPYFAMELVQGGSLLEYADQQGLDTRERLALLLRVCEAVHYAHQKGVIHRDLKPANILVDEAGQPRILDFGVARATNTDLQATTVQTGFGQLVGTIPYMSPEQATGDPGELDIRSDVYALGVILYELLTGHLPYPVRDKMAHEALRVIREVDATPLRARRREFRGDLETILGKALAKEKARRYQSCLELSADIGHYLADEPITARPPTTLYQFRKFTRRHRALVASLGVVMFVLVCSSAISTWLYLQAHEARALSDENARTAERERQRADRAAAEAQARLAEVIRLADLKTLEDLDRLAREELWPVGRAVIPAIDEWLSRARDVASRLPAHRRTLATWRSGPPDRRPREVEVLREVIDRTARLITAEGGVGSLAEMKRRREVSASLVERTVERFADVWEGAIDEIALSDRYAGLEIVPQPGLVPLEPDSDSELWEFWDVMSGERPERDWETGQWRITERTGLVMVLIPGGRYRVGAVRAIAGDGEGPVDPEALEDEGPVREVTLEPFFISKYEMTAGQWTRLREGRWPVEDQATVADRPTSRGGKPPDGGLPAVELSWQEACDVLRRAGLTLPAEAQWEVAARGGTLTVWWTGNDASSLGSRVNLADQSARRSMHGTVPASEFEGWDDGAAGLRRVDRGDPNGYGLVDVVGNVWEWCRDGYDAAPSARSRDGDGLRLVPESPTRVRRGGSFASRAAWSRSAARAASHPDFRHGDVGLRPVRPAIRSD